MLRQKLLPAGDVRNRPDQGSAKEYDLARPSQREEFAAHKSGRSPEMTSPIKPPLGISLPAEWFSPQTSAPVPITSQGRRAVIYARHSNLGPRESSIERQVESGEQYIHHNDLILVDIYADRARTGSVIVGREELHRMKADAEAGRFDIVVCEHVDRIGRMLRVTVEIWAGLEDLGIEIHDTETGRQTAAQIGAKGGAAEEECKKLVSRNRKGKMRKARSGQWVGPRCFGYKVVVDGTKTKRVINEPEAVVIREIFELYDKGVSSGHIAQILNARPPEERGNRYWIGADIKGSRKFGHGLLRRLRYGGIVVYGRNTTKKRDNGTYKTRANPMSKWAIGQLDDSLRIVERDLFKRVQERLERDAKDSSAPKYSGKGAPLNGLIRCATCGAGMSTAQKRRDAGPRVTCNRARNPDNTRPDQSGCSNTHSTALEQVEEMVCEVLSSEIANPAAFEAYFREYNTRREAILNAEQAERPKLERRLREIKDEQDELWERRHSTMLTDEWKEKKGVQLQADLDATYSRLQDLKAAAEQKELHLDLNAARDLVRGIQDLFDGKIDTKTATGTKVLAALRTLVDRVVLDITDDAVSVNVHCVVTALAGSATQKDIVVFTRTAPRMRGLWDASAREVRRIDELVKVGKHALTDEEWRRIGPLVPDCVGLSKRGGTPIDPRRIVEAALLHLHEGVPLAKMPQALGPQDAMFEALRRLSSSGSWDTVIALLREIAPARVPAGDSDMFTTVPGRCSNTLQGLPRIRALHEIEVAKGKFAPTDVEWSLVSDLIPEQVLTVDKAPAKITPREFFHAILYKLKSGARWTQMPLRFGSEMYLRAAINRLVGRGIWDQLVERLLAESASTLDDVDIRCFDKMTRSKSMTGIWRRAIAKESDRTGVPSHAPTDAEWALIGHLFPPELLFVNNQLAVATPRLLAHALLYRVREKIPVAAFPAYFGRPDDVGLTITKFVFHHLWDAMVDILQERSPTTLERADLSVFRKLRRAKTRRYAHLVPAIELPTPAHAPSDAQWALAADLITDNILVINGMPRCMEPRRFLHAIFYMVTERTLFGGLPNHYFGNPDDCKFAMRKFIRHHHWDILVARLRHFDPEWADGVDLTRFDHFPRSKNAEPEFRMRERRRSPARGATAVHSTT